MPCETCGKQHDHSYGSGRFCSFKCAHSSPNVKHHLDHLRSSGIIHGKAPYGTWKCIKCNLVFETKDKLMKHYHEFHQVKSQTIIQISDTEFECAYCHKRFSSKMSVMSHMRSCKCHPNKDLHDMQHRQDGLKKHEAFKSGALKSYWLGKKHSEKSKQQMRQSAVKYLQTLNSTPCRYVDTTKTQSQFQNKQQKITDGKYSMLKMAESSTQEQDILSMHMTKTKTSFQSMMNQVIMQMQKTMS